MNTKNLIIPIIISVGIFASCQKFKKSEIVTQSWNEEYVVEQDVNELQNNDDAISLRIDSILNGEIDAEFVSTGYLPFSVNQNDQMDIAFEIVDLQPLNDNQLPEYLDSLAARVIALHDGVEILDNSTFGYADALREGAEIDASGAWESDSFVLGTFAGAGNFNGEGERYLAYRIKEDNGYQYGWFKLMVSEHNDQLNVISHGINMTLDKGIEAGQIE